MGKKLDALLGRTFKTSKFKSLVKLALSRLVVLKNQCEARLSQARSDTAELLKVGPQERALLRVEIVIKEQNMSDVLVMIEEFLHILMERVHLIEANRECPDELQEAISSLIFAASRRGDFPELQDIRSLFVSRYGKEFASRAVDLRNNCGVNGKMIQKLSTRRASHECKMEVLQDMASKIGVTLEEPSVMAVRVMDDMYQLLPVANNILLIQLLLLQETLENHHDQSDKPKDGNQTPTRIEEIDPMGSGGLRARKRYHDVASAAQAAFESAAYAAEAARAAVELSRYESQDNYSDGPDSPPGRRNQSDNNHVSSKAGVGEQGFGKIHPIENFSSDSEGDDLQQIKGVFHPESSGVLGQTRTPDNTVFDESDDDEAYVPINQKSNLHANNFPETKQNNASADSEEELHFNRLNLERRPISVRARRGNKW